MIVSDQSEHPSFIAMKPQNMDEVLLESNHIGQIFLQDNIANEIIVEQNVEVGSDDDNQHGEIILVPNSIIKQEDIIEGGEVVVGSTVGNEVVIGDHISSHLTNDRFMMGSSLEMDPDQIDDTGFDDSRLVIDTHFKMEEPATIGFDCNECGAILKSKAALKKHVKSHGKQRSGKSKKNGSEKQHDNILISNRPYCCPSCTYSSQRRDKLDKHMQKHVLLEGYHPCGKKRHKPEAPLRRHRHNAEEYRCPYCPYSCTVYKALKKHQKLHNATSNKQFTIKVSCKICGKDRATEADLQKHMKKHRNDKYFLCDICGFASIQLKKKLYNIVECTLAKNHISVLTVPIDQLVEIIFDHMLGACTKKKMYISTLSIQVMKRASDFSYKCQFLVVYLL